MAGGRGRESGGRRLLTLRNVLVGSGLVALAVGVAFTLLPGAVPAPVRTAIDDLVATAGPGLLSAAVAVVVGLYAVYRLWRSAGGDPVDGDERFRGGDPDDSGGPTGESRSGGLGQRFGRDRRTGSSVDDTLAWAAASTTGDAHPKHVDDAKRRLRSVLRDVLAHGGPGNHADQNGHADPDSHTDPDGHEDPRRAIATGAWTDDPVAAVFLGDPDDPALPDLSLWQRLYGWLYPTRAFRAHYERTLAEIEARCADAVSGYEPPEQVADGAVDAGSGFEPVDGGARGRGADTQEVQG